MAAPKAAKCAIEFVIFLGVSVFVFRAFFVSSLIRTRVIIIIVYRVFHHHLELRVNASRFLLACGDYRQGADTFAIKTKVFRKGLREDDVMAVCHELAK